MVLMGGWSRERDVSLTSGRAVCDALQAKGYNVTPFDPPHNLSKIAQALSDIKPDVIVCTSDYTALGILSGCRHTLNINVPQDLCIIGLGDIPAAGWTDHDLSTVKIPHNELVRTSVTTLISKIETQSMDPESIKLDAKLILRGTIKSL